MLTAEQLAEAKQTLAAAAQANGNSPAGWAPAAPPAPIAAASSWAQPAAVAAPGPEKVLVPMKLQAPGGGTLRIYFQFPGEMAANPQALMAAIGQLAGMGLPIDVYVPKQNGFGGGGYNRNGGGGGGWGNRGW
ncbi:MAG TPA: hypothetical protein VKQ28_05170 [Candidatus Acidoferrum sp.]|nr:hypothetical protein [Candidatus Acidoferrum sp.]